jgi:hypothetical protein
MEMLEIPLTIIAWCVAIIIAPLTLATVLGFFVYLFSKKD